MYTTCLRWICAAQRARAVKAAQIARCVYNEEVMLFALPSIEKLFRSPQKSIFSIKIVG
jgi:hypothetical protein